MPAFRTLLLLGRVSNLPTVWSNCLAGWWLGGGGSLGKLPCLFAGTSLLYVAGMYLNDAFDAAFDRQHRKERPIPSGKITPNTVWILGFTFLLIGNALLFATGVTAGMLGALLALHILLYNAIHKVVTFSPLLMGACRFWVYVIASACGYEGVTGWAVWSGLALMLYVVGLSFVARVESTRGPVKFWAVMLLAAPVVLALLMNAGSFRRPALLLSVVLVLWTLRCLRTLFWSQEANVGRAVSGLLAGIVFVDWVAAAHAPREMSFIFIALFFAALLAQRYVPAT